MIPELGYFSLILALCLASLQAGFSLWGAHKNYFQFMRAGNLLVVGQFIFIFFSYSCLTYSFLVNDFSVLYVAQNSSVQLPWFYQICAVWGAHEGSMLLWLMILSIWTLAVLQFSHYLPKPIQSRILGVLGILSVGFLLFLLLTSNPFQRLLPAMPMNGTDLNALLQDPGFLIHPPMLYLGYVGFAVTFAFAITSLITGKLDAEWARWVRPWTLLAWCFLTIGITLGSWWAYRELGWGGWWFWDPVENASFLPWLTGTALLHSLAVTDKRELFKAWTVLLAIVAFVLSLLGTFLVRSGILTSVHAFAVDPLRGSFMLAYILIVVGASFTLYAWRCSRIAQPIHLHYLSRETLLLSNNIFLTTAVASILLGTLYPLILEALNLGKISVGSPYFNMIFIPLMVPVLLLMGIGPHCYWQKMSAKQLFALLKSKFLICLLLGIILPCLFTRQWSWSAILGSILSIWIVVMMLTFILKQKFSSLSRSQWGMIIAHLGIAITAIGITMTSIYSVERDVRLSLGDSVVIANYTLKFTHIEKQIGPNYESIDGTFQVEQHNKNIATMHPQKRYYTVQQRMMTDAAILPGLWRDLYIALGEAINDTTWSARIYYKPMIRWIWLGGLMMLLGGLIAMTDRRYLSCQRRLASRDN